MDNFYNSYDLAKCLLQNNIYCTATSQAKRKDTPAYVAQAKLKRGHTVSHYSDTGIMIGKWCDTRDILYISSHHANMTSFINQRRITQTKPLLIIKYNVYMSGMDRNEQMLSYYPYERKIIFLLSVNHCS